MREGGSEGGREGGREREREGGTTHAYQIGCASTQVSAVYGSS